MSAVISGDKKCANNISNCEDISEKLEVNGGNFNQENKPWSDSAIDHQINKFTSCLDINDCAVSPSNDIPPLLKVDYIDKNFLKVTCLKTIHFNYCNRPSFKIKVLFCVTVEQKMFLLSTGFPKFIGPRVW